MEIPFSYDKGMDTDDLEFVVEAFRARSESSDDGRSRAMRYCSFKTYLEALVRVRALDNRRVVRFSLAKSTQHVLERKNTLYRLGNPSILTFAAP